MTVSSESSAWYEEWFDTPEYDVVYSRRDDADASRLLELILEVTEIQTGQRVLDMACGRGRHSILLAREGFKVSGIDLSSRAIEIARQKAAQESLEIDFQLGDMRHPPCSACFDMVVNLFTSFGYFDDDDENQQAVRAMAEALTDNGWLVQDYMNGAYWAANLVPFDQRSEDGLDLEQRRWIEGDRLNKEITIARGDGDQVLTFTESVRIFTLADFKSMYEAAGLEIERVVGDFDGGEFGDDSRRMIIFSKRRAR